MSYYGKVLAGFVVLNLYLNVGIAKAGQFWLQVLLILLFFPLLKGILLMTGLSQVQKVGVHFHSKWYRNLWLGFSMGFSFWLLKYLLSYLFGGFDIKGVLPLPDMFLTLFMIVLTFLVGSFLNDMIIRGYVFGHLKGKLSLKWIFVISLSLYVFDDVWNEGFSLSNMLFSLILGLSLTYAIYHSGSIWANTGIHWGLNVCYGLFNGTLGSSGGGIFTTHFYPTTVWLETISYVVPLLMFLVLYWWRKRLVVAGE